MSVQKMRRDFPVGATFTRDPAGELWVSWLEDFRAHNRTVREWIDEFTIAGTTYDVIETGAGEVVGVLLSPPGGGVSFGPVASRRFRLVRHEDVSGVSGTGVITHGVEWPDGAVCVRWSVPGMPPSTSVWDSIEHVIAVHGHQGKTEVEWID